MAQSRVGKITAPSAQLPGLFVIKRARTLFGAQRGAVAGRGIADAAGHAGCAAVKVIATVYRCVCRFGTVERVAVECRHRTYATAAAHPAGVIAAANVGVSAVFGAQQFTGIRAANTADNVAAANGTGVVTILYQTQRGGRLRVIVARASSADYTAALAVGGADSADVVALRHAGYYLLLADAGLCCGAADYAAGFAGTVDLSVIYAAADAHDVRFFLAADRELTDYAAGRRYAAHYRAVDTIENTGVCALHPVVGNIPGGDRTGVSAAQITGHRQRAYAGVANTAEQTGAALHGAVEREHSVSVAVELAGERYVVAADGLPVKTGSGNIVSQNVALARRIPHRHQVNAIVYSDIGLILVGTHTRYVGAEYVQAGLGVVALYARAAVGAVAGSNGHAVSHIYCVAFQRGAGGARNRKLAAAQRRYCGLYCRFARLAAENGAVAGTDNKAVRRKHRNVSDAAHQHRAALETDAAAAVNGSGARGVDAKRTALNYKIAVIHIAAELVAAERNGTVHRNKFAFGKSAAGRAGRLQRAAADANSAAVLAGRRAVFGLAARTDDTAGNLYFLAAENSVPAADGVQLAAVYRHALYGVDGVVAFAQRGHGGAAHVEL